MRYISNRRSSGNFQWFFPVSGAVLEDDSKLWRFTFTPLPALAERGININLVRTRLPEIGELRNSVPQVLPGGGIAFEFIPASQADESALVIFVSFVNVVRNLF